jgi:hypothetical protein
VAQDDNKTFEQYFNEGLKNVASTAFPQLSKFMSFDGNKKKDEDKASDSVDEQEEEDTPRKRNKKSVNAVANEMVLDALGGIDERLKVQSIVLVSQLEQQTITNQLLGRLALSGGGAGGAGGTSGGSVTDAVVEAVGGASMVNFIKSWGTRILGGAVGMLAAPEIALGAVGAAAGYGAYKATSMDPTAATDESAAEGGLISPTEQQKTDDPTATQARISAAQKAARIKKADDGIENLQNDLNLIVKHLKMNVETEENRAKLIAEEVVIQKKITDLQKDKEDALKQDQQEQNTTSSGDGKNSTPTETSTSAIPSSDVPTAVKATPDLPIPINDGSQPYVPTPVGQGETPLSLVNSGKRGTPAGGDDHRAAGGDREHSAGTGGTRSTGVGHTNRGIDKDSIDIAIKLRDHLMQKYGMTKEQATGFAGTMGYESGNFHTLQEVAPVGGVGDGHRGGYGYAQWTGPRRRDFNAYIAKTGLDPKSYEANEGFMDQELQGQYAKAVTAVKKTNTVEDAAKATLVHYEGMPDTAAIRALGGKPATAQHTQRALDFDLAIKKRESGIQAANTKPVDANKSTEVAANIPTPDSTAESAVRPDAPQTIQHPKPRMGGRASETVEKNAYRPETSKNANLDANNEDDRKYRAVMDDYSDNKREYNRANGWNKNDHQPTVAGQLAKKSHDDSIHEASRAMSPPIHQQIHSSTGGSHTLTPPHKTDRMSDKDVGSANPPAHRLKELFTSTENGKGF